MARALLTGITGQDGSYLTELLLEKGYEVHGIVRNVRALQTSRLSHLLRNPEIYKRRLFFHYGDLREPTSIRRVLVKIIPDEFYHLAGQSDVGLSFEMVESTCEITAMGTLRLLEMLRDMERPPRFFHASSSEVFGRAEVSPQDEQTPFRPVTPYGCAKALATNLTRVYRQTFGLYCCNGILYNHESPRRGENFVTKKICLGAVAIKEGRERELILGNLSARRDWGDAREYVRGMWLALQQPTPDDFVFASGELHTVLEIVETAFAAVDLDWRAHVKQDPGLFRPDEPVALVGNPVKARQVLQWNVGTRFKDLITEITLGESKPKP